jgi:hypothetical protein
MNVWFGGLAVALMCQRSLVRSSPRSLFPDFHSQCARFPALTSPLLFCFFQNDRLGQTPNGISAQEFKFSERGGCRERGGLICDYYSINGAQIANFVNVVGVKIAMSYAPHLRNPILKSLIFGIRCAVSCTVPIDWSALSIMDGSDQK